MALGPFIYLGLSSTNRNIFLPSVAWNEWWPWCYASALGGIFAVLALIYWRRFEHGRDRSSPATTELILGRVGIFFAVLTLPLWLFVVTQGIVRDIIAGPVLAQLTAPASFKSYEERDSGRRTAGKRRWVVIATPAFGTLNIEVHASEPYQNMEVGTPLVLLGKRRWIGDFFSEISPAELP